MKDEIAGPAMTFQKSDTTLLYSQERQESPDGAADPGSEGQKAKTLLLLR